MRPVVLQAVTISSLSKVMEKLAFRINENGDRIFMSRHEIHGVVEEEIQELRSALSEDGIEHYREELLDVAVAAIWGVVSIDSGRTDW